MSTSMYVARRRIYRQKAALMARALRARRPKGGTALERREWNLRTLSAVHNFIAHMRTQDLRGK